MLQVLNGAGKSCGLHSNMLNVMGWFSTSVVQFKAWYNIQSLYTLFAPICGDYLSSPFPFAAHHTLKLAGWTTGRRRHLSGECLPVRQRGGGAASPRTADCVAGSAERASISSLACWSRPLTSSIWKFTCMSLRSRFAIQNVCIHNSSVNYMEKNSHSDDSRSSSWSSGPMDTLLPCGGCTHDTFWLLNDFLPTFFKPWSPWCGNHGVIWKS